MFEIYFATAGKHLTQQIVKGNEPCNDLKREERCLIPICASLALVEIKSAANSN